MNDTFRLEILFGRVESETRYIPIGPGAYECQSRCKRYERGTLVETTEWAPLSRIRNVPDDLAVEFFGARAIGSPLASTWIERIRACAGL